MNKGTEQIKQLMSRYYVTKEIIDRGHLIKILGEGVTINQFNDAIDDLLVIHDSDLVSDVLYVGFVMNYFNEKNEDTLRRVLSQNFHKSHEDIVSLFQLNYNANVQNIPVFLKAIEVIPDYLQPNEFKYPYVRKLIYALGAQPEPNNIESLEKLLNQTNDDQIKELVLHQISKRKELGGWEINKKLQ